MRTRKRLRCLTSAYHDYSTAGDLIATCRIIRTEGEGRDIFLNGGCDESEDEGEAVSDEDEQWW